MNYRERVEKLQSYLIDKDLCKDIFDLAKEMAEKLDSIDRLNKGIESYRKFQSKRSKKGLL